MCNTVTLWIPVSARSILKFYCRNLVPYHHRGHNLTTNLRWVPPYHQDSLAHLSRALLTLVTDNFPRIHPIIKDGKQVSQTHYFLLMPRQKSEGKQTAAVKPYNPSSDHKSHYRNITEINSVIPVTSNIENQDPNTQGATGSQVPYVNTDSILLSECSLGESSRISAASASDKIRLVQTQVHGVTQQESQIVLANHNWEVHTAVCYLKVEQLFSIGIATHERCRGLLESYDWDLHKAADVLLSELSRGSAV